MPEIDFTAAASVSWQHPPYGATAIEEFVDDFNLSEAVRFVMERLQPDHRVQRRSTPAGRNIGWRISTSFIAGRTSRWDDARVGSSSRSMRSKA